MTRFEAIKQGHIKIVDISIVCNFTVDKCELNPAYVIKNIDSPKDLLNGQKKRSSSENRIREGANKRGNTSRLTQSFHFFMFEPIFSPVNALNQPI